jgi:hypothetical protein
MLGVNGDADRETAKHRATKEQMTWRSWWDGQRPVPILTRWGVSNWPTHYLLDTKGVIRYQDPQGEVFYRAIDHLTAEAEAESKSRPSR